MSDRLHTVILETPKGIETDEKVTVSVGDEHRPVFYSYVEGNFPSNKFDSLTELASCNWPKMTAAAIFEWQGRESIRIANFIRKNQ